MRLQLTEIYKSQFYIYLKRNKQNSSGALGEEASPCKGLTLSWLHQSIKQNLLLENSIVVSAGIERKKVRNQIFFVAKLFSSSKAPGRHCQMCVKCFFREHVCSKRAIAEKVNFVIKPTQKCCEEKTSVILRAKRQWDFFF